MGYRYIGSKNRIAQEIMQYIGTPTDDGVFIDAFSGTGVVAECASENGWKIQINDMMNNALVMSEARLLSYDDVPFVKFGGYEKAIEKLNSLDGVKGFFYKEYSPASKALVGIERKYFTESNAMKIDAIIAQIKAWKCSNDISQKERVLLLANLISSVNDVANIAGTYGCFLSNWSSQAKNELLLHTSPLKEQPLNYCATNDDVFDIVSAENDVVYLDPPYTKRQYASYYHILETIVCCDEPVIEGVSGLRPWKEKASVFCYKTKALSAIVELIKKQKAKKVFLSYSSEGHVELEKLMEALEKYGDVKKIEIGTILRYTPNSKAVENNREVKEYLIEFCRRKSNE